MGIEPRTESQSRLLADSKNVAILDVLDDAGGSLRIETLARRLIEQESTILRAEEYERRVEKTKISLHHERLPKLADAGLLDYESDRNVVRGRREPAPQVDWAESATPDAVADTLDADAGGTADIGTIEGRDAVIEYGRKLADEAEDELFCIYATTDLLTTECVSRVRSAIDRGVTMYMGSRNPEVRSLTRERLPEATIWEPQQDWLNTPSSPRIGRLVFADRRHLMLAVLEQPDAMGGDPGETAIVGKGHSHPLVVLVRDLLGARLDHLDFQSEEFRSELSP